MKLLKELWMLLRSERGDENGAEGTGGDSGTTGQSQGQPDADINAGGGDEGQGDEPPAATPKYGDFGDTPKTQEEAIALVDKVYSEYGKIKPITQEYEKLRGKTTATERNLASIRKALEGSGIKPTIDENGEVRFDLINQSSSQRQKKFQDTHKQLFDPKVLEAIQYMLDDTIEDRLSTREQAELQKRQQFQSFVSAKQKANDLMIAYFPQIKVGDPTFNQSLYDRATEIWTEKYKSNPQGELIAALQAARELNIPMQAISKAKLEGFEAGKANKKIVAPITGGGQKPASTGFKELSKDEYLKLSPDARLKYDEVSVKLRNQSGGHK